MITSASLGDPANGRHLAEALQRDTVKMSSEMTVKSKTAKHKASIGESKDESMKQGNIEL